MPTTSARVTMPAIDSLYSSATAGTAPAAIASPANGDLIPISSGSGTLITLITSGTGATVTLTNQVNPNWGTGGNVTITLATTDIQDVYIRNDQVDRMDPGVGQTNAGYVSLSYTTPTALKVYSRTIP